MTFLSQNKKIALSAVALFVLSLTSMILFLSDIGGGYAKTDVLGAGTAAHGAIEENAEILYRKQLDDTKLPIVVIDSEGNVKYSSDDLCKMLATDCGGLHGKLFFDYMNAKDLPQFFSAQGKVLSKGEKVDGIGPFRLMKGKKELLALFNIAPVPTSDEKVTETAMAVKDITEQAESLKPYTEEAAVLDPALNSATWMKDLTTNAEHEKSMLKAVNKLGFVLNK